MTREYLPVLSSPLLPLPLNLRLFLSPKPAHPYSLKTRHNTESETPRLPSSPLSFACGWSGPFCLRSSRSEDEGATESEGEARVSSERRVDRVSFWIASRG